MARNAVPLVLASLLALALAGPGLGSQSIARGPSQVSLEVNRKGVALVTFVRPGRTSRVHLLAWGAVNARPPTRGVPQVKLALDYSGGWRSRGKRVWKRFRDRCAPYDGPPLAYLVAACKASDGSYWALQSWQRRLPGWGAPPTKPIQRQAELRLSHWTGELARLEVWHDWKHQPRFHEIFGRLTYRGRPVHAVARVSGGRSGIGYARRVYFDTLNSGYGRGWRRANAILAHRTTGTFCAIFARHHEDKGVVNKARGERYRLTIAGPGVTPDLFREIEALPEYDPSDPALVAHELEMNAILRGLRDTTRFCAGD